VAAFQSSSHHRNISNTLKAIINSTICAINYDLLNWFIMFIWIYKLGDSKVLGCKEKKAKEDKSINENDDQYAEKH